jgi:hypothetical protein
MTRSVTREVQRPDVDPRPAHRLGGGGGLEHAVAGAGEDAPGEAADRVLVLGEQDGLVAAEHRGQRRRRVRLHRRRAPSAGARVKVVRRRLGAHLDAAAAWVTMP